MVSMMVRILRVHESTLLGNEAACFIRSISPIWVSESVEARGTGIPQLTDLTAHRGTYAGEAGGYV
jgi:hypothetical protein